MKKFLVVYQDIINKHFSAVYVTEEEYKNKPQTGLNIMHLREYEKIDVTDIPMDEVQKLYVKRINELNATNKD